MLDLSAAAAAAAAAAAPTTTAGATPAAVAGPALLSAPFARKLGVQSVQVDSISPASRCANTLHFVLAQLVSAGADSTVIAVSDRAWVVSTTAQVRRVVLRAVLRAAG